MNSFSYNEWHSIDANEWYAVPNEGLESFKKCTSIKSKIEALECENDSNPTLKALNKELESIFADLCDSLFDKE